MSHFHHSDQLVLALDVNLSHNRLTALDACNMLQCVRALNVNHNKLSCITRASLLRLDSLQELTLRDNRILSLRACHTRLVLEIHVLGPPTSCQLELSNKIKTWHRQWPNDTAKSSQLARETIQLSEYHRVVT